MEASCKAHHDGNCQQAHNHDPFHRAVVLIWVPAGQDFNPVAPEDGQNAKNSCAQGDDHLQPRTYLRSSQPNSPSPVMPFRLLSLSVFSGTVRRRHRDGLDPYHQRQLWCLWDGRPPLNNSTVASSQEITKTQLPNLHVHDLDVGCRTTDGRVS